MFRFFLTLCAAFSVAIANAAPWKGVVNPDIPALKKRAEAGDTEALSDYAFHSLYCLRKTPYEPKLIFDYFSKASEAGHIEAQIGLAICHFASIGTWYHPDKMLALLEEPVAKEHPLALELMGYGYLIEKSGLKHDEKKAKALIQRAAEEGCILAQSMESAFRFMEDGAQQKRGEQELVELHENEDLILATNLLFSMWVFKQKIEEDYISPVKPEELLAGVRQNAALGSPEALYLLYEHALLENKHDEAISYLLRSASQGSERAWSTLDQIQLGKGEIKDSKIFQTTEQRRELAIQCYLHGMWTPDTIEIAASEIISSRLSDPLYRDYLPKLEKDIGQSLLGGRKSLHDLLGTFYLKVDPEKHPKLFRPELGEAHFQAARREGKRDMIATMAWQFFRIKSPTVEQQAKAYACAHRARANKNGFWRKQKNWDKLLKFSPEAIQRGEELIKDKYPQGEKHMKAAIELLRKEGQLPKKEEEE